MCVSSMLVLVMRKWLGLTYRWHRGQRCPILVRVVLSVLRLSVVLLLWQGMLRLLLTPTWAMLVKLLVSVVS